ncbi:hypothetical protein D9M68_958660 [compost metagenome]
MGQYHQWCAGFNFGAQGIEAAAQALVHFLVRGVVGLADFTVAAGVAEKQGDDAP